MTSMLEQVARNMWGVRRARARAYGVELEPWGDGSVPAANGIMDEARAAIMAMRAPTVAMLVAAYPCSVDENLSHEDKVLGAACCLKLGGAADIGIFEGEAVKQAAFLVRDYRLMVAAALEEDAP